MIATTQFVSDLRSDLDLPEQVAIDPATGGFLTAIIEALLRYVQTCIQEGETQGQAVQRFAAHAARRRRGRRLRVFMHRKSRAEVGRSEYSRLGGYRVVEKLISRTNSTSVDQLELVCEELAS